MNPLPGIGSSRLLSLFTILIAGFACASVAVRADSIDDQVAALMAWENIPGLSLAVIHQGRVIKAKGYGLANLETSTSATPETVYKIGSVSKQFISAAVMVLVQDGKLGLNDSIRPFLDSCPDAWGNITVAQLLSHTSGIARELPSFDPLVVQSDQEFIKAAYALPLRSAPGAHWSYSNINYYCLAQIIAKVSGMPWDQFVAERIFAPAGMTATRTTTWQDIIPHRASGYSGGQSGFKNAETWRVVRPSGAFLSTILDFSKWDAALAENSILSQRSKALMWSPLKLNDGTAFGYGLGWFIDEKPGHLRLHHSGGVPGFICEFDRFVDDRVTVIVMANIGDRDLGDFAINVAGHIVPALMVSPPAAIADQEPHLTAETKNILEQLTKHQLRDGPFTPKAYADLLGQFQRGFFNNLTSFGAILDFAPIDRKTNGREVNYSYKVEYRSIVLFAECSREPNGRIVHFGLHD